jgi:5-methylcytosine-specific restriction protein A
MKEYRYHRMAENHLGWRRPHSGRLGAGKSYVETAGFGFEDWNFSGDVWDDGLHHLFLQQPPKQPSIGSFFNILLGAHSKGGALVIGFAENATYKSAKLDGKIWQRRADEIDLLDAENGLAGEMKGLSVSQKKSYLKRGANSYAVAVSKADLHILDFPIFIPKNLFNVKMTAYRLLKMTSKEYKSAKKFSESFATKLKSDELDFPEGKIVERLHMRRERSSWHANLAKSVFEKVDSHGIGVVIHGVSEFPMRDECRCPAASAVPIRAT